MRAPYFSIHNSGRHAVIILLIFLVNFITPRCDCDDDGANDVAVTLQEHIVAYSGYDYDKDGINEITGLSALNIGNPEKEVPVEGKLLLVFVETRLLNSINPAEYSVDDLMKRLDQYRVDCAEEGFYPYFISTEVYDGTVHQDGCTVLALRRFLKSVRVIYRNLAGAVFVGNFPESMLVRSCIWRVDRAIDTPGFEVGGVTVPGGTSTLDIIPEVIAHRSDLVLSDLDGDWESVYYKEKKTITGHRAVPIDGLGDDWPKSGVDFISEIFETEDYEFEDFFYINDEQINYIGTSEINGLRKHYNFDTAQRHPELTEYDRTFPNPIAHPEIIVSRINPWHIAENPDPAIKDMNGDSFLDSNDEPGSVVFETAVDVDNMYSFWVKDPDLERTILVDYFDRNHEFRTGAHETPFRTITVGYPEDELSTAHLNNLLLEASTKFEPSLVYADASLWEYIQSFRQGAVLRGITAHSNECYSAYCDESCTIMAGTAALEDLLGGKPWKWHRMPILDVHNYAPSLNVSDDFYGDEPQHVADLYIHRTIWENGILEEAGSSLIVHNGCLANSPVNAETLPFSNANYGVFQNVEGILFYCNGLAILARAKVFNDSPEGFGSAFVNDPLAPFGMGLVAYFDHDASDASLVSKPVSLKKTYTWSINGDWTLRLNYE